MRLLLVGLIPFEFNHHVLVSLNIIQIGNTILLFEKFYLLNTNTFMFLYIIFN